MNVIRIVLTIAFDRVLISEAINTLQGHLFILFVEQLIFLEILTLYHMIFFLWNYRQKSLNFIAFHKDINNWGLLDLFPEDQRWLIEHIFILLIMVDYIYLLLYLALWLYFLLWIDMLSLTRQVSFPNSFHLLVDFFA